MNYPVLSEIVLRNKAVTVSETSERVSTEIFNPQTRGDDTKILFLRFSHLLSPRDFLA
jgi:hypothetical protein